MKQEWNIPELKELFIEETEKSPNLGTTVDYWEVVDDHWEVWAS